MDIVKIFASVLTLAGMGLLTFSALAFMQGSGTLFGVEVDKIGSLVPFLLGFLFFVAGVYLFKYIVTGTKK